MRQRIDCALLASQDHIAQYRAVLGPNADGRLNIHWMSMQHAPGQPLAVQELADKARDLRQFDICLLPATAATLGHVRTSLNAAHDTLTTPVVILSHDLQAAALRDLYDMHVADFIRMPLCLEELRARLQRIMVRSSYTAVNRMVSATSSAMRLSDSALSSGQCADPLTMHTENRILDYSLDQLDAMAVGRAVSCATDHQSFKSAKQSMTASFEQAYLRAVLTRSSGNIAMAARYAQKHRRAFWALMCKHQIDPEPFRRPAFPADFAKGKMDD